MIDVATATGSMLVEPVVATIADVDGSTGGTSEEVDGSTGDAAAEDVERSISVSEEVISAGGAASEAEVSVIIEDWVSEVAVSFADIEISLEEASELCEGCGSEVEVAPALFDVPFDAEE